jgi:hypothetical protein
MMTMMMSARTTSRKSTVGINTPFKRSRLCIASPFHQEISMCHWHLVTVDKVGDSTYLPKIVARALRKPVSVAAQLFGST